MQINIVRFPLKTRGDIALMAGRSRLLGALTDLTRKQRRNLGKAVSEICHRIIHGSGQGNVQFSLVMAEGLQFVEVILSEDFEQVTDRGKSDSANPRLLQTTSLQRLSVLVDRFRLDGHPNEPNIVHLGQTIPQHVRQLNEVDVEQWAEILAERSAEAALAAIQRHHLAVTRQIREGVTHHQLRKHLQIDTSEDESAKILALVASKTDNAVIIMDQRGLIEWVNDAFIRLTGFPSEQALGKSPVEFLFGDRTDSDSVDNLRRALLHGHSINEEFLIYREDGQTHWVLLSFTPVRDERNNLVRWIAIGIDVTQQRQAQVAMKAAKEAAEAANEAKSQFLANMSHEIRTPMNAIMGMTDLALDSELTVELREFLETVKYSSQSLLELLNDILDLSKIEAGKMELESVPFDLHRLIHETLATLAFRAREKDITLATHLSSEIPQFVRSDANRLRQVLLNLVGNAIKFTQEGDVTVTVESQWQNETEASLLFAVRDSGIGISPNSVDPIFEAFQQADSSHSRQFGGSGLGLTITAELLHLMHGRIWVDSEVGKGSKFQFSLRLELAELDSVPTGNTESFERRLARRDEAPSRALRILVADDNAANRQLATKILERRGHHCVEVASGVEVLDIVQAGQIDLVIMDIQMPGLDGMQTTAAIRSSEGNSESKVPIIALTAHAMIGDREKCLEAGMDAYLSKPLRAQELYSLAETICESSNVSTETQQHFDQSCDCEFAPALHRLEGDLEFLKEQMDFFLRDAPPLLARIRAAVDKSQASELHLTAHRLKGLIGTFEEGQACDLALQLEIMAQSEELENAASTLERLEQVIADLMDRMREFVATH